MRLLIPWIVRGWNPIWYLMPVKQEKGVRRELGEASDAREAGKRGLAGTRRGV